MMTDKGLKTGFDARAVLAGLSLLAAIGATEVQKRVLAAFLPCMSTDAATEKDARAVTAALASGDEKAAQNLPEQTCIVAFVLDYFETVYRAQSETADAFGFLTRVPDEKPAFWKRLASKSGFYFDGLFKNRVKGQRWRVRSTHFAEARLLRRFLAHFGFSFPVTADTKGIFLVEDTGVVADDAVAVMASLAAHTAGIFQIERVNGATTGSESGGNIPCGEAPDPLEAYFLPENDRCGTDFVSVLTEAGRAVAGLTREGQPDNAKRAAAAAHRRDFFPEDMSFDWIAVMQALFLRPGKKQAAHFAALEVLLSEPDADERIPAYCRGAGLMDGAEDSRRDAFEGLTVAKSFAADAVPAESVPSALLEAYAAYFWGRILCCERARRRLGAKSMNAVPFAADEAVWVARFFEEAAKTHDVPCAGKVAGYARSLAAACSGVPYEVQCSSESDAALVSEILRKFLFHYECPEKNRFVFWVRTADKWILASLAAHLAGVAAIRRDRAYDTKKVPRHHFLSMGQGQMRSLTAQALRRTVNADPLASFFPQPSGLS